MEFTVKDKVALVTGGASGLGYIICKKLLESGVKGLAIIDIVEEKGKDVETEFRKEFGTESCIFIKTDVSIESEYEAAFEKTVETFKQLDIVINNAAVIAEMDWKKCLQINLGGCIAGTKFAIDTYLPKHKSGPEALIINVASVVGVDCMSIVPIYTTTKHGIVALTRSFGTKGHYDKTKVRILSICPGHMDTGMNAELRPECYNFEYMSRYDNTVIAENFPMQRAQFLADSLVEIANTGSNGSVWIVEGGEPPYEVEFRDRLTMKKK